MIGDIMRYMTLKPQALEIAQVDRALVAEVAQGFLAGAGVGTFDFTALLFCIYEADQAALIAYEGLQEIEKAIKDKSAEEAIGGIIAMLAFVQQFKQSIPVCKSVDPKQFSWQQVNELSNIMLNPGDGHLKINAD